MQLTTTRFLFFLLLMALSVSHLSAQGWERTYGDVEGDGLYDILPTADGGYITVGQKQMSSAPFSYDIYLVKTDADGMEDWSQTFSINASSLFGRSIQQTNDGGYIIGGSLFSDNINRGYLVKTDELGNFQWEVISPQLHVYGEQAIQVSSGSYVLAGSILHNPNAAPGDSLDYDVYWLKVSEDGTTIEYAGWEGGTGYDACYSLAETIDGGVLLAGKTSSYGAGSYDTYLIRLDTGGDTLWTRTHGTSLAESALSIAPCDGGNYVIAGQSSGQSVDSEDVLLGKINASGDLIWWKVNEKPGMESANDVMEVSGGGFILTGAVRNDPVSDRNVFLLKTNALGEEEWKKDFGGANSDEGNAVHTAPGLGFAIAGYTHSYGLGGADGYLIRTDYTGISHSCFIAGNIHSNLNNACLPDNFGQDVPNYIVEIEGPATYFGTTDENGDYLVPVKEGTYNVRLVNPSPYWETCEDSIDVSVAGAFDTAVVNFSMYVDTACSMMRVDLSTLGLRRCFQNTYTVRYSNIGTLAADSATIDVTFDPYLLIDSASIPWTQQVGQTFTFDVGTVHPFESGSFEVYLTVDCDSTQLGQTHCSEAHIFPDEFCTPPDPQWDGASIELEASCDGDSVTFMINNIGSGDMEEPLEFIVIEDVLIGYQGDFQLESGQDTTFTVYAEGSTLRMEADQSPGHPGISKPCISVEGCGDENFSTGYIIQYPLNDADLFVDTDCRPNVGSYDPNDKQGFPIGYGSQHYISRNTDIEYLIRFQNTGTDTAFTVVIRDTLSQYLDPTSIEPGASSHPYRFELYGPGILKFTFDNIMLPDSNVNEPASHGFVKFRVCQNPNLAIGTQIRNKAGIYFDFNEPIITNITRHKIGENFITIDPNIVSGEEETQIRPNVTVYPNPFVDYATFELEDIPVQPFRFTLFDSSGRLVHEAAFTDNTYRFNRGSIPPGIYFFHIRTEAEVVTTGKVVLR